MRQYKSPEETKEIQQFSNFSKFNLPNSKRTLIPSYQPINNQENINHKAFSFYSNKFNSNSVGPDFIPNEEPQVQIQRKSAAKILKESSQPRNIRHLKPNVLHKKYVESSQINNIPGPEIMKRFETNKKSKEDKFSSIPYNKSNNGIKNLKRKNTYVCRNNDIESFQRKVYRDYNSNIACLPGVTINEKEKRRTLVAANAKKNESHICFGFENDNNNNNYNDAKKRMNNCDYYRNYYRKNNNQRPSSFSGKRIIRNKNRESDILNLFPFDENNSRLMNARDYFTNKESIKNQKYIVNKNKSQIIFG